MKKNKVIYWASTGIVAGIMLWSAINFNFNEEYKTAFRHLGLPDWFKAELTAAKLLGVIVLLVAAIPQKIKEFAYFGFAIVLLSAPIAHLSSGDSVLLEVGHSFFFIMLVISYIYYHRVNNISMNIRN